MRELLLPHASQRIGDEQRRIGYALAKKKYVASTQSFMEGLAVECLMAATALAWPMHVTAIEGAVRVGDRLIDSATYKARAWTRAAAGACRQLAIYLPKQGTTDIIVTAVAKGEGIAHASIDALDDIARKPLDRLLQVERDMIYWDAYCQGRLPGSKEERDGTSFSRDRYEALYRLLDQDKKIWGTQAEIDLDLLFA
jgi:hypothetical protein